MRTLLATTIFPFLLAEVTAATVAAGVAAAAFGLFLLTLFAFKSFYRKTSADKAFVRTGAGRAKVVIDGGAFVVGFLHTIKWISLESMRLAVKREGKDALITKDRFRVDIAAEFYVKVEPKNEQILAASRSLGEYSMTADNIMTLIEAKLVGALRSVAATKVLVDLHEKRDEFQDEVHKNLREDLQANGLTLESVSIVSLDQTDKDALDPNNIFDAEGLKKITDATEQARSEKNAIQRRREIEIKQQDVHSDVEKKKREVEGVKQVLDLDRDRDFAAADQAKDVETRKAARARETLEFKYEQEQAVKTREIEKDRSIAEAGVMRERVVEQANIEKETFLIQKRREREENEIAKELAVERARRDKDRQVEEAEAVKLAAVAERERADQAVITVEKTAEAERHKAVVLIQQRAESEKKLLEKQLAADAAAYETEKRAAAEATAAEQQARAIERLAKARLEEAEARAAGEMKMFAAKNSIAPNVLLQEAVLKMIDRAPEMIHQAMLPAEKISDIRVINVGGLGGGRAGGSGGGGDGAGVASRIVQSVIETGAVLPVLRELLKFADIDADGKSLTELAQAAAQKIPAVQRVVDAVPREMRRGGGGGGGGGGSGAGEPHIEPPPPPAPDEPRRRR